MASMETKALEVIATRLGDEDTPVTYKWLSRKLDVKANVAKLLLEKSLESQGQANVVGIYCISGETHDSSYSFSLVPANLVEETKKNLAKVTGTHLFALCKGVPKDCSTLWSVDAGFYRNDAHISQKFSHIEAEIPKAVPRMTKKPSVIAADPVTKENKAPERKLTEEKPAAPSPAAAAASSPSNKAEPMKKKGNSVLNFFGKRTESTMSPSSVQLAQAAQMTKGDDEDMLTVSPKKKRKVIEDSDSEDEEPTFGLSAIEKQELARGSLLRDDEENVDGDEDRVPMDEDDEVPRRLPPAKPTTPSLLTSSFFKGAKKDEAPSKEAPKKEPAKKAESAKKETPPKKSEESLASLFGAKSKSMITPPPPAAATTTPASARSISSDATLLPFSKTPSSDSKAKASPSSKTPSPATKTPSPGQMKAFHEGETSPYFSQTPPEAAVEPIVKKVIVRKKVMKKKTFVNERGYLVTEEVAEYEDEEKEVIEYPQPETPSRPVVERKKPAEALVVVEPKERKSTKRDKGDSDDEEQQPKKKASGKKAAAAANPKDGKVQKTMMSFFKKNDAE